MYRGGDPCALHSLTAAVGRCHDCGDLVCESCEVFIGMTSRCRRCAAAFRERWSTIENVSVVLLLVAGALVSLSTGIVLGMASSLPNPAPIALFLL